MKSISDFAPQNLKDHKGFQNSTRKSFDFKGCPLTSTYVHVFDLDPQNPENRVEYLQGYSNHKGSTENSDKDKLLAGVVSRILAKGYLQKSSVLRWYINSKRGSQYDEQIVLLGPDSYALFGIADSNYYLKQLLTKYYEDLNLYGANKATERLNEARTKTVHSKKHAGVRDVRFENFQKGRFESLQDLDLFYHQMVRAEPNTATRAAGFYHTYSQLHFNK